MSQFVTMRTKIREPQVLLRALRRMGYEPIDEERLLEDWRGSTSQGQRAQIIVPRSQLGEASNDLGFRLEDGTWTLVISEYDTRAARGREFRRQVAEIEREVVRHYALETVVEKSREQGFHVVEQQEQEDGTIRVVVRRWG